MKDEFEPLKDLPRDIRELITDWMLMMAEIFLDEYKATDDEDKANFEVEEAWLTIKSELE